MSNDQTLFPVADAFLRGKERLDADTLLRLGQYLHAMPDRNDMLASIIRRLLDDECWDEAGTLVKQLSGPVWPQHPELLFRMALYYDNVRQNEDGLNCIRRAISISPDVAMYHNNAGVLLERQKQYLEAYQNYREAHRLNPHEPLHVTNLAKICINHLDKLEEGIRHYNYAIALDFKNTGLILQSANAFHKFGRNVEAADRARLALRMDPTHAPTIFSKLTYFLKISYASSEEMQKLRTEMEQELERIPAEVDSALQTTGYARQPFSMAGWQTLFLLAYQGRNDVEIMRIFSRELARTLRPHFPGNISDRPMLVDGRATRHGRKIRVGFCTAFFNHHSVWKIPLHGFYTHLDRSRFEIHSFHFDGATDFMTEEVRKLSDTYFRTDNMERMVAALNQAALDVLIFPELGMHVGTFLLSTMRFAPVQCQALGHPVTSGSNAIDYVLSSDLMEPPDAQQQYSEEVVRLPGLGVTYTYPYEMHRGSKQDFGLSEKNVVILTPQSTFKYLPEHDDLYPAIAVRLPMAKFVFIAAQDPRSAKIFEDRLAVAFSQYGLDAAQFVLMLPGQGKVGFMKACNMADIFLDNPSWSGHNTALDALHSHTPVVAMRGDAMRKNHSAGILNYLGLDQYIADSKADLVNKCVHFATSAIDQKKFAERIGTLLIRFQDTAPVRALEAFMLTALARHRKNDDA